MCFCALDSNDAWNGFQGGTLDSPSLSKNISHQVKLKNEKIHFAVCTLAVWIFVFYQSISELGCPLHFGTTYIFLAKTNRKLMLKM